MRAGRHRGCIGGYYRHHFDERFLEEAAAGALNARDEQELGRVELLDRGGTSVTDNVSHVTFKSRRASMVVHRQSVGPGPCESRLQMTQLPWTGLRKLQNFAARRLEDCPAHIWPLHAPKLDIMAFHAIKGYARALSDEGAGTGDQVDPQQASVCGGVHALQMGA